MSAIPVIFGKIFGQLEGLKKTHGNDWNCLCPAHDDHVASLVVTYNPDTGRLLLYCRAGCSFADIRTALGAEYQDFRHPDTRNPYDRRRIVTRPESIRLERAKPENPPKPPGQKKPKRRMAGQPRIVATYDYCDGSGRLLYQVVRYEPKTFRCRRPDPSQPDGWNWSMEGVKRVLYHFADVRDSGSQPIYLVEGEKDADNLRRLGFVATTNQGGAMKWDDCYTAALAGKRVVLVPDYDEPNRNGIRPGWQRAVRLAEELHPVVASLRILEYADFTDGKTDITDWLNERDDGARELRALTDAMPEFEHARQYAGHVDVTLTSTVQHGRVVRPKLRTADQGAGLDPDVLRMLREHPELAQQIKQLREQSWKKGR